RGRSHPLVRPSDKQYRVLMLGDSFTEGVQVGEGDVVSAQLERIDPRLEVLNAGVGGYGTVQEYLYLRNEGLRFRPDLVLVMFFVTDLDDTCLSYDGGFGPRPYAELHGRNVEIVERLDPTAFQRFIIPIPFGVWLSRHSYLYYFLNTRVYQHLIIDRIR